ncbi:MAG: AMP-binding protein [Pseudomonadota bacterium]|nr:AMP-binding protein [Pseudomonadota bacterium]
MKINWKNLESHLVQNPKLGSDSRNIDIRQWPGHIWVPTSGTTAKAKLVGLSKFALLSSAQAVNSHINSNANDVWIQALPDFHVGGLSIGARAFLSGANIFSGLKVNGGWDPETFVIETQAWEGTLASLVPTQIFDLVSKKMPAPKSLRAVFVGGANLSPTLYTAARELGWPVLPTFGMTESGSQIASAELSSLEKTEIPKLRILDHLQVQVGPDKTLSLKGDSLFTGYISLLDGSPPFIDPKVDGWFVTEDLGEINLPYLKPLGRLGEFVKVSGEGVYLNILRDRWQSIIFGNEFTGDAEVIAKLDERLGHQIELVTSGTDTEIRLLVEKYNEISAPYERIKRVSIVSQLDRSELGKQWI